MHESKKTPNPTFFSRALQITLLFVQVWQCFGEQEMLHIFLDFKVTLVFAYVSQDI